VVAVTVVAAVVEVAAVEAAVVEVAAVEAAVAVEIDACLSP
jgi:hypothetical protein